MADDTPTESTNSPDAESRRSALKKAAAASTAAAVTWASPAVEGLGVTPNYASAATYAGGPFNGSFNWTAIGATNGTCATGQRNAPGYYGATSCVDTYTYNGAMVGPFNLAVTVHDHTLGSDPFNVNINFTNIDPPFQSCQINGFVANGMGGGTSCNSVNGPSATMSFPIVWNSNGSMTIVIDPEPTLCDYPNDANITLNFTCNSL